jgi:hypothetical protein
MDSNQNIEEIDLNAEPLSETQSFVPSSNLTSPSTEQGRNKLHIQQSSTVDNRNEDSTSSSSSSSPQRTTNLKSEESNKWNFSEIFGEELFNVFNENDTLFLNDDSNFSMQNSTLSEFERNPLVRQLKEESILLFLFSLYYLASFVFHFDEK